MLYEQWLSVARNHGDAQALHDLASGRRWTFRQLQKAAEQGDPGPGPVVFPRGNTPEFVLDVVRSWRLGRVVCPLESGQPWPPLPGNLPPFVVHLKSTSASTGPSRLVAFREEQLAADAENIVNTMGLRTDWPNLGVISLAHSYGFSNLVLPLLLQGIPLVLVDGSLPEALRLAAGGLEDVTLPAVPALWRAWHEAGAIPEHTRLAISAGAALPLPLEQEVFAKQGLKIHNFYGSSECGGIGYDETDLPRADAACVGSVLQDVQVAIGEDGCVEVRGKAVGETYWPEHSDRLSGGVFRTSDLGEILAGRIYLRGRAGDQINVAGRKVSPEVIERALMKHEGVKECLVFGVPSSDAERGESIVGCLVLEEMLPLETLRNFLIHRLPAWQVPREWWLVDSLAANHRGKISRADWRSRYLSMRAERLDSGAVS